MRYEVCWGISYIRTIKLMLIKLATEKSIITDVCIAMGTLGVGKASYPNKWRLLLFLKISSYWFLGNVSTKSSHDKLSKLFKLASRRWPDWCSNEVFLVLLTGLCSVLFCIFLTTVFSRFPHLTNLLSLQESQWYLVLYEHFFQILSLRS